MDENLIKEISTSLQTGTPLGGQKFKDEIEELLGMKVGYTSRVGWANLFLAHLNQVRVRVIDSVYLFYISLIFCRHRETVGKHVNLFELCRLNNQKVASLKISGQVIPTPTNNQNQLI
jgi:hypothetical protein